MVAGERTEPTKTGSKAIPKMRTRNFIEISCILIEVLHHRPGEMVSMIGSSNDLEFVKTGVNKKEGFRRKEGRAEGGGREDMLNLGPQLRTYQVVMKGIEASAAAKDAMQPNHLVVSVSGGPRVDPSFDDVHSRPRREFEHELHRDANKLLSAGFIM